MSEKISRLRQRLVRLAEAQRAKLDAILSARGPLIRGAFGTRARRCGKPGCRCVRGERHVSRYLAATDSGRVRQVHVPKADEQHVGESVERYRRFMSARADLAEQGERLLAFVDELGRALLEPYPRDKPLPPASKVGRRPKRRSRRGQR
jgi:transposase